MERLGRLDLLDRPVPVVSAERLVPWEDLASLDHLDPPDNEALSDLLALLDRRERVDQEERLAHWDLPVSSISSDLPCYFEGAQSNVFKFLSFSEINMLGYLPLVGSDFYF